MPSGRQYSSAELQWLLSGCISSVGHILGNGVVFVTVGPNVKELNIYSQAFEARTSS